MKGRNVKGRQVRWSEGRVIGGKMGKEKGTEVEQECGMMWQDRGEETGEPGKQWIGG